MISLLSNVALSYDVTAGHFQALFLLIMFSLLTSQSNHPERIHTRHKTQTQNPVSATMIPRRAPTRLAMASLHGVPANR
jgi:hypothetical protein